MRCLILEACFKIIIAEIILPKAHSVLYYFYPRAEVAEPIRKIYLNILIVFPENMNGMVPEF